MASYIVGLVARGNIGVAPFPGQKDGGRQTLAAFANRIVRPLSGRTAVATKGRIEHGTRQLQS